MVGTVRPLDAGQHNGALDDYWDAVDLLQFTDNPFGIWAVTYQGEQSAHQSVVWFKVTQR